MYNNKQKSIGIIYTKTGDAYRDEVMAYHNKPDALNLNKTPYKVDVAGLKSAESKNIFYDGYDYQSLFTIGFEVEKNTLHRNSVKEYELFCGFERDGSCGYEAVTHILPLLPKGKWRNKVFDMMHKAEKIIDDRYSKSDKRCGGHVTISCASMTGEELREAVRRYSGIVLALFRYRLKNAYCGANRRMFGYSYDNDDCNNRDYFNSTQCYAYDYNGWHRKYQMALVKGDLLEFRLVNKYESVKQMMRRYELFYELVNVAVNNPKKKFAKFIEELKPLLMMMYDNNAEKVNEISDLAVKFQKFIDTGEIHESIATYL